MTINRALDRPVWGGESSSQILRRLDSIAKFFAVFNAISGFHQIAVDEESSKLLNITTSLGNLPEGVGTGIMQQPGPLQLSNEGINTNG